MPRGGEPAVSPRALSSPPPPRKGASPYPSLHDGFEIIPFPGEVQGLSPCAVSGPLTLRRGALPAAWRRSLFQSPWRGELSPVGKFPPFCPMAGPWQVEGKLCPSPDDGEARVSAWPEASSPLYCWGQEERKEVLSSSRTSQPLRKGKRNTPRRWWALPPAPLPRPYPGGVRWLLRRKGKEQHSSPLPASLGSG